MYIYIHIYIYIYVCVCIQLRVAYVTNCIMKVIWHMLYITCCIRYTVQYMFYIAHTFNILWNIIHADYISSATIYMCSIYITYMLRALQAPYSVV